MMSAGPAASRALAALDGSYEGPRAAALSGVPVSTVYHWARQEVVVPSVSQERQKLWSYADLMALRVVHWLRHDKPEGPPASPMKEVRRALSRLGELGLDIWSPAHSEGSALLIDRIGKIFISEADAISDPDGQIAAGELLDLLGPFSGDSSTIGPDLIRPRPLLRIVPGKCSGEPHLSGSRLTTRTIAALADRGYEPGKIIALYPGEPLQAIEEAIDLERALSASPLAA